MNIRLCAQLASLLSFAWLLSLVGCSFDSSANKAHGCGDCAPGQCYLGYCVQPGGQGPDGSLPGGGAGTSSTNTDMNGILGSAGSDGTSGRVGSGNGTGGSGTMNAGGRGGVAGQVSTGPCVAGVACYLGDAATRGKGRCHDGTAVCSGALTLACNGQVLPTDELCNAIDDDCDGKIDDEVTLGSCAMPGAGACGTGMLRCENGAPTCVASNETSDEVCNGLDDDCDGTVDEGTDGICFPSDGKGCVKGTNGAYACTGTCTTGKQACKDGKLSTCTGAVVSVKEVCGGNQPADEDCDGRVDNGCTCTEGQTQNCYGGLLWLSALGRVGICRWGTQRCMGGTFDNSDCEGDVVEGTETCANLGTDDDCNGTIDDGIREGLRVAGAACTVASGKGICHDGTYGCRNNQLTCITPAPKANETACDTFDDDCDGLIDEDFPRATDEQNCGACGTKCATGQLCCDSVCRTISQDPNYCGSCGMACTGGMGCCGGTCAPLGTKANCARCGDACGAAGTDCCGGSCTPTGTNDNCSKCNDKCVAGSACCGGSCTPTGASTGCGNDQTCCDQGCVAAHTHDHCMACIACGPNETCCGTSCSNVMTDATHCGGCDKPACSSTCPMCVNGACTDPTGVATCP